MSKWLLVIVLAFTACHCYPNIEPAHARGTNCTTTCHRDSGGNWVCHERCR